MEEILAKIATSLPPCVAIAGGSVEGIPGALLPEESCFVARAVPKRYREFRAGRIYARTALSKLGHCAGAIPVGADRCPVWPDGFIGSLSHTDSLCVAAVAPVHQLAGIGLDIEADDRLPVGSIGIVCKPEEIADRNALEDKLHTDLPKLLFVVKEAVFKLRYPLTGVHLDFQDITVSIDTNRRRFHARILRGDSLVSTHPRHLSGSFGQLSGHVFACVSQT